MPGFFLHTRDNALDEQSVHCSVRSSSFLKPPLALLTLTVANVVCSCVCVCCVCACTCMHVIFFGISGEGIEFPNVEFQLSSGLSVQEVSWLKYLQLWTCKLNLHILLKKKNQTQLSTLLKLFPTGLLAVGCLQQTRYCPADKYRMWVSCKWVSRLLDVAALTARWRPCGVAVWRLVWQISPSTLQFPTGTCSSELKSQFNLSGKSCVRSFTVLSVACAHVQA